VKKEKMTTARVNVYEDEQIIARVKYNNNLDVWNGSNFQSGGVGHHLGLTQLKDGRFVLIHGSDWQGDFDWAEIITKERAIQEILQAENVDLLDKYGLRKKADEILIEEND